MSHDPGPNLYLYRFPDELVDETVQASSTATTDQPIAFDEEGNPTQWLVMAAEHGETSSFSRPARKRMLFSRPVSFVRFGGLVLAAVFVTVMVYLLWVWVYLNTPGRVVVQVVFKSVLTHQQMVTLDELTPITTTLELAATAETTGQLEEPDQTARATARFINGGGAVTIPAGTTFGNVLLREPVSVPGLVLDYASGQGRLGITTATVYASMPGVAGNGAGGVYWYGAVRVEVSPLTGGTNRLVRTVSDQDIQNLKAKLENELNGQVEAATLRVLPAGWQRAGRAEVVAKQFEHLPTGSRAGELTMKLIATVKSYGFEPAILLAKVSGAGNEPAKRGLVYRQLVEKPDNTFALIYTEPVNATALRAKLTGWTGNRSELTRLLTELGETNEICRVAAAAVPPDYPARLVLTLVEGKK